MARLIMIMVMALSPFVFAAEMIEAPISAVESARQFFAFRWPQMTANPGDWMIESGDSDLSKAVLAAPFRRLTLDEEATHKWARSNELDPAPYAVITQYFFPVVSEGVVLLAITVNRVVGSDSLDTEEWRATGFVPTGHSMLTTYSRASSASTGGTSIDIIEFRGTAPDRQVLIRAPSGGVMALTSDYRQIPLASAAKRWKGEHEEYEKRVLDAGKPD